jgi:hypothetical protein
VVHDERDKCIIEDFVVFQALPHGPKHIVDPEVSDGRL